MTVLRNQRRASANTWLHQRGLVSHCFPAGLSAAVDRRSSSLRGLKSSATLLVLLQGVATTVYAATAPELEGHSGAYLEDCRVKQPSKVARDQQQAQRLWQVTEEQIAAAAAPGGFKP